MIGNGLMGRRAAIGQALEPVDPDLMAAIDVELAKMEEAAAQEIAGAADPLAVIGEKYAATADQTRLAVKALELERSRANLWRGVAIGAGSVAVLLLILQIWKALSSKGSD